MTRRMTHRYWIHERIDGAIHTQELHALAALSEGS
jgi:hypothetical protein